ncbi:S-methyl-5-thioribose kinase [Microbacterium sp. P07]|uniref:S-methyl-5-thioribose kinase n=1 Tax=Microbacterium sp. P07 TaxID=3366952 RepID=UPI00374709F8
MSDLEADLLSVDTVAAYLVARPHLAGPVDTAAIESVVEVGDGNLNLVFIVTDSAGNGVVVKQSLPHVRVDPTWPLTRTRAKREAVVLAAHEAVDPGHVPALYGFDEASLALSIEDLSDHAVWRNELNAGRLHTYAAAELGRYVGAVGFATSVFGTPGPERRRRIAEATNPELSEITEDLVFTEPYVDHEHNGWLAANAEDVRELRADRVFVREIGLAKQRFQEDTQSLVHGDLHTGSVFVRASADGGSVRAFDSEFGTYAPTGFDLGAVWANLIIAAARASVLGREADAEQLLALPVELMAAFEAEYTRRWPERVDPRVYGDDVLSVTLRRIRSDAAMFAAAKAVRRIVGFSKVADIQTLPEHERAIAARRVLLTARTLGVARLIDPDPKRLTQLSREPLLT